MNEYETLFLKNKKMRHTITLSQCNITLRPVEETDIESLRCWRNDSANAKYIRALPYITPQMQREWFEAYLKDDDHVMFAALRAGELIGSVSLYDRYGEEAQFGRLLIGNPTARGKGCAAAITSLCLKAGFETLGLSRIYASVHTNNLPALKTYVRVGFLIDGTEPFAPQSEQVAYRISIEKERFLRLNGGMDER